MPRRRNASSHLPLILSVLVAWTAMAYQAAAAADQARGTTPPSPPQAQGSDQPQTEKGRQAVMQVCTPCHVGLMRTLDAATKTPEQWKDTVFNMIARGAHILPGEIEPIVAYLASPERRRIQTETSGPAPSGRRGAAVAAAPSAQASLDTASLDTEGKSILARRCLGCHDSARATSKAASEGWPAVLDRMVSLGAVLTPAERGRLVAYLDSQGRK